MSDEPKGVSLMNFFRIYTCCADGDDEDSDINGDDDEDEDDE